MNWFNGEVAEAIQKALKENKIFIVYIEGDNEDSKKMGEIWNNQLVANCCRSECCVAIRIKAGSLQGDQFAKCYPVLVVPSTYFINQSGVPTDIIPGFMEAEQFVQCIDNTLKISSMATTTTDEAKPDSAEAGSSLGEENEITDEGVESAPQESSQATGSLSENVKRARDLAEKLRLEKEKKEHEEEKEKEKRRRIEGQQIAMAKRSRDDLKSQQWIQEQAKAKAEAKAAREAVRKRLEQDKMEKKMKFEAEKENEKTKREARKRAVEEAKIAEKESTSERKTTRIQFRLPDGSAMTREFASEAQLNDVFQSIKQDVIARFGNISLATVYPRRQFKDNEFNCTLRELSLVPSAALIVIPQRSSRQVTTGNNGLWDFIKFVLAPIIALLVYIKTLLFGQTTDTNAPPSSSNIPTSSSANLKRNEDRQSNDDSTYKREGNVYKFKQDDDGNDDEDKTWNGNSTQQM